MKQFDHLTFHFSQYLALLAIGRLNSAAHHLALALDQAQNKKRPRLTAALLLHAGQLHMKQEHFQKAIHAFDNGLRILKNDASFNLENVVDQLVVQHKGYVGTPEQLPDLYLPQAVKDLKKAENDAALPIRLLMSTGVCHLEQNQDELALNYYKILLEYVGVTEHQDLMQTALTNAAELYRRRGDLSQATILLDQAFELLGTDPPPDKASIPFSIRAAILYRMGTWLEAVKWYEKAISSYEQTDDRRGLARTLVNLATIYLDMLSDYDKATPLLEKALSLSEVANDTINQAFANRGLALCFLNNEPEKAI
ncbi:MAG: tetratricopeptide repeat protein, partial [Leadbetterella sp.]|nr:tetratricopeptide repeat protein [Leadbetterella sp.]